jgi:type I restriction enzyme S subunit
MNWPSVKISDFCKTGSGGTPSRQKIDRYYGGTIPWVKSGELKDSIILDTEEKITEEALKESSAKLVSKGSILMAMYGATIGKTSILDIDATTNQAICNIQPNPHVADVYYIWFWLRARVCDLLQKRVGGAQPNISQQIIKNTSIPLPPLSEQKRIVEILDQADVLRKKRAEADAKIELVLPAFFYNMFGDPATNPKEWVKDKIGAVITTTQYGSSKKANSDQNGVAILRMNNIDYSGYLDLSDIKYIDLTTQELKKYKLEKGDILFNRTNSKELVGKTGLWQNEIKAVLASYLIRVRVHKQKVFPEYLWAYMNSPYMKKYLLDKGRRAIGMANINAQELRSMPIMIPDLNIQKSFAAKIYDIIDLRNKKTNCDIRINDLFNVLLYHAFSGDLTAKWREVHMKELLKEMDEQAKLFHKE